MRSLPKRGASSPSSPPESRAFVRCLRGCLGGWGVVLCVWGSAACRRESPAQEETAQQEPQRQAPRVDLPGPPPAPKPGVAADGTITSAVPWIDGPLEVALEQARQDGKQVLIDFGAYWCPPCQKLDEEVFTDPAVGSFIEQRFVPLHIEADVGEGEDLARRFHVQALPTLLVLDADGHERGRIVDAHPVEAMLTALDQASRGENTLARLEEAVENDPDDLAARYRLGHAYALAARAEDAQRHFAVLEVADPTDELGWTSRVMFDRALYLRLKLADDPEGALALLHQLQSRFPQSTSATAAHKVIARIHHRQGRDAEAFAALERLVREDPQSVAFAKSFGWFCFRERFAPQRGRAVIDAALALDPADAELHYLRAELSHLAAEPEAALASIRAAAALQPASSFYQRQLRRFEGASGT